MSWIKNIFSNFYIALLIIVAIALLIFRSVDIWSDFALSKKFIGPYIDPLFNKFPIIMSVIALLIVVLWVILHLVKLEIAKEDIEKDRMNKDEKENRS